MIRRYLTSVVRTALLSVFDERMAALKAAHDSNPRTVELLKMLAKSHDEATVLARAYWAATPDPLAKFGQSTFCQSIALDRARKDTP